MGTSSQKQSTYERALAFLDDALADLDDTAACVRPARPARSAPAPAAPSRDREHDRRGDRQGFRPW
jgi:hypothetical protein